MDYLYTKRVILLSAAFWLGVAGSIVAIRQYAVGDTAFAHSMMQISLAITIATYAIAAVVMHITGGRQKGEFLKGGVLGILMFPVFLSSLYQK